MNDALANKATVLRDAVLRLIAAVGPDRATVDNTDTAEDPESIGVVSRSDPSRAVIVSIAGMPADRYVVHYDKLKTLFGGDASIARAIASDIMFEGLTWVTRKIIENGIVTGEFESVPKKLRRLRA